MGPSKSELWPSKGACYLCGVAGPLCRSHIIPKFVGDWLRSTNITGRLRNSSAPNRLVQDLEWRYLLCQACELRFSKFESEVSEKIFLPIHERKQDRFRYGQSFALFAVSVAWRGLIVLRREEALGHLSDVASQVEAAERVWREFLLGRLATPAPHVVHALPMDVPTNLDVTGRPPHFARFLLRAPAIGTRLTESGGYVVIKLARLFIFGTVASGTERRVWKATQIHPGGGLVGGRGVSRAWLGRWISQPRRTKTTGIRGATIVPAEARYKQTAIGRSGSKCGGRGQLRSYERF